VAALHVIAMVGAVKFFNAERGFGFIVPDGGGGDVFVHVTAVEDAGLDTLEPGQRIEFEIGTNKKKADRRPSTCDSLKGDD
jgi:CspA family cold shock protein